MEENSDAEIEFSPPTSINNGSLQPWGLGGGAAAGTESLGSVGQVHRGKEDLTDSILTWQIMPPHVRQQSPITPSQVYGIHHLLRLFGQSSSSFSMGCLLYTSPSPRDDNRSRMPSSA